MKGCVHLEHETGKNNYLIPTQLYVAENHNEVTEYVGLQYNTSNCVVKRFLL